MALDAQTGSVLSEIWLTEAQHSVAVVILSSYKGLMTATVNDSECYSFPSPEHWNPYPLMGSSVIALVARVLGP